MYSWPKIARFYKGVMGLCCLTLAAPLIAYAYNGLSMRYSGDDYCYASVLRLHGFFETQWYSYLNVSTYNGDRYSLTLFSSLAGIFPPAANGALPVLAIILFLAGIYWVLSNASRLITCEADDRPGRLFLFLSSEALVFFTLYLAPSLGQSLYWRSGMLPYLAPLIANTFLIGFVLSQARQEGPLVWSLLVCLILSILAGGFSETGVAIQGAYLGLALVGSVILNSQKPGDWPKRAVWLAATSLASTLIALILLLISPTNHARMTQLPPPSGLAETISITLHGTIIFAYSSIKSQIIPNLLLIAIFFLVGLVNAQVHPLDKPFPWRRWFGIGTMVAFAGTILLFCSMLPFAYIQQAFPEPRALITSRFIMVVCQSAIGWLVGSAILPFIDLMGKPAAVSNEPPNLKGPYLVAAAAVFLLAFSVYPLHAASGELSQSWHYQKWARFWDARNLTLIQAQREGVSNVNIMNIDHIIPNVAELSPDAGFWYNGCASKYYGVTTISASLPGWDQGDQKTGPN